MHANMWEALGPELGGSRAAAGVGGTRTVEREETFAAGPRDELALLLESVTEEGPRIRELERLIGRTGEVVSSLPLRWPVRGRVNSEYGKRTSPWGGAVEHHSGLDISAPPGTPVMCPAPGKVLLAGAGGDYGRHVLVQHANGVRSLYGHLSKVEVRAGQSVEKGQLLGLTGSTGRSTGPHLHYELRVAGKSVNPRKFLWEGKDSRPLPEAKAARERLVAHQARAFRVVLQHQLPGVERLQFLAVADADQRRLGQPLEEHLHEMLLTLRIERRRRLVHDDEVRLVTEEAREAQALLLAAGQDTRPARVLVEALEEVTQADVLERLAHGRVVHLVG
jgi:hypothetical protein